MLWTRVPKTVAAVDARRAKRKRGRRKKRITRRRSQWKVTQMRKAAKDELQTDLIEKQKRRKRTNGRMPAITIRTNALNRSTQAPAAMQSSTRGMLQARSESERKARTRPRSPRRPITVSMSRRIIVAATVEANQEQSKRRPEQAQRKRAAMALLPGTGAEAVGVGEAQDIIGEQSEIKRVRDSQVVKMEAR